VVAGYALWTTLALDVKGALRRTNVRAIKTPWCHVALLGVILALPCGCLFGRGERLAGKLFVAEKSCPADRVTVIARAGETVEPPADIAGDPQRLEVWKATRAREASQTYYVATGCGAASVYYCYNDNGVERCR
jgi:hypothetical protein